MCSSGWPWSLDPPASSSQVWTAIPDSKDALLMTHSAMNQHVAVCAHTHSSTSTHTECIHIRACMCMFMCFPPYTPVFCSACGIRWGEHTQMSLGWWHHMEARPSQPPGSSVCWLEETRAEVTWGWSLIFLTDLPETQQEAEWHIRISYGHTGWYVWMLLVTYLWSCTLWQNRGWQNPYPPPHCFDPNIQLRGR